MLLCNRESSSHVAILVPIYHAPTSSDGEALHMHVMADIWKARKCVVCESVVCRPLTGFHSSAL